MHRWPTAEPYGRSGSILLANPTDRSAVERYGLVPVNGPGRSGRMSPFRDPEAIRADPALVALSAEPS